MHCISISHYFPSPTDRRPSGCYVIGILSMLRLGALVHVCESKTGFPDYVVDGVGDVYCLVVVVVVVVVVDAADQCFFSFNEKKIVFCCSTHNRVVYMCSCYSWFCNIICICVYICCVCGVCCVFKGAAAIQYSKSPDLSQFNN